MSLTSQDYGEIIGILDVYRQNVRQSNPSYYQYLSTVMCELNTMRLQVEKENLR